ncbi:MAG TPA: EamA family transporter [Solirubrobacteraceae bacterium]|nr:EamA family transporter [Solirubrobacteraceae bacterium]
MTAVALSLAAAITWGFSDFAAGLKSRRLPVAVVLLWVECSGLVAGLIAILVTAEPWPDGRTLLFSVIAGACGLGGLAAFYRGLAIGTMSVVAPISAAGVTLPVIVGIATGDALGAVVACGLVVTFAGVVLASREPPHDDHARRRAGRAALLLALAAALGFGGYFTFGDVAADGSVLWLLTAGRLPLLPVIFFVVRRQGHAMLAPPADRLPLVAIGLVDLTATGLYALANTHGALAIVAVVGSLYPVVTILLAQLILHERMSRVQGLGVITAMAGIAMVSAG